MKYNVQITTACTQTVLVEADSYDQAKLKALTGQFEEATELQPKYRLDDAIVNVQDQDLISQKNNEVQKILEAFSSKMNDKKIPEIFSIKSTNFHEVRKVLEIFGLEYNIARVGVCHDEQVNGDCFEYVFWEVGTEEPTELIEAIKYSYTDDYQF